MDQNITVCIFAVAIFAASMVSARLPFYIKKDVKQLHKLIAFGAGVMLGVLFIMLMPEALERNEEAGYDFDIACCIILIGFVFLFAVDFIVKKRTKVTCACKSCRDEHTHDVTSISALAGLGIHALFDGLALAAAFIAGEDVGIMVLIAICLHKVVEVFSLSSTMLMSKNKDKTWMSLVIFCMISPVAAVVSYLFIDGGDVDFAGPALCFSVGVFMFVALCDILPEAFHNRERDNGQMVAIVAGLVVVLLVKVVSVLLMGDVEI